MTLFGHAALTCPRRAENREAARFCRERGLGLDTAHSRATSRRKAGASSLITAAHRSASVRCPPPRPSVSCRSTPYGSPTSKVRWGRFADRDPRKCAGSTQDPVPGNRAHDGARVSAVVAPMVSDRTLYEAPPGSLMPCRSHSGAGGGDALGTRADHPRREPRYRAPLAVRPRATPARAHDPAALHRRAPPGLP